jgi:glutamate dehydrogenase (NAD(P)+)
MRTQKLSSVDGVIVFDLDDVRTSAGGTRLAPDIDEAEVALLARAMTYKFGVLEIPYGGAKAGIRATLDDRDAAMARYCEEIRPLVESRRFLTGPDLGTSEADFAPLRTETESAGPMNALVDGVPFEDLVTGFGVAAAADAAAGPLEGKRVAVEGFGKVGSGVVREAARRGASIVALSTVDGCIADPAGLDVEALLDARIEQGDAAIATAGLLVRPTAALFGVAADVLVPGARTGVLDAATAATVAAAVVVPAANAPYTESGLLTLESRGIVALADFVTNAGGVLGYRSPLWASTDEVMAAVEERIVELVSACLDHPDGPYRGACAGAERFIATWLDVGIASGGPPLAPG